MLKVNYKFFIITIISLVLAIMLGGNLPYAVFYTLFISIILSALYIWNRRKSFSIDVDMEENVYSRGDSDSITINVGNDGNFANYYTIIKNNTVEKFDNKYNGNMFTLKGNDNVLIKNDITFNERGIFNFGDISWSIRDVLFIFKYSSNANIDFKVKVYPKVKKINKEFMIKNYVFQKTLSNKSGYEDPYTVRDVRKYSDGDNLKKIHWKISAKHNELYVKNMDNIMGQHCDLFMDMSEIRDITQDDYENQELSVEFCVSLINHMFSKGLKTTLHINNLSPAEYEIEYKEDFLMLMDYFLENKSIGKRLFSNYIKTKSLKLRNSNWVGIICVYFNEGIVDELISLKDYGCDVNLFYMISETIQNNKIEKLKSMGIKCINISKATSEIYE